VLSLAPYLLLLVSSVLPQVEDPIPGEVGIEFPFAIAGGVALLAGLVRFRAATEQREEAVKWGGLIGFGLGSAFYLLAAVVQLASSR
jgi:hypothetical protein